MVNFDKQTVIIVGLVISLVTCFYLFKETQKQKTEFSALVSRLSQVPSAPANDPPKKNYATAPTNTLEVIDSPAEDKQD